MRIIFIFAVFAFDIAQAAAFKFKNVETDKLYFTQVQDQIRSEFDSAMKQLEAKANLSGIVVQPADLRNLKREFHQRAFNHANCLDRGIQARTTNSKVDVSQYARNCVKNAAAISDQIERSALNEMIGQSAPPQMVRSMGETALIRCGRTIFDVPVFDFLRDEEGFGLYSVNDFNFTKDCVIRELNKRTDTKASSRSFGASQ